MLDAGNSSWNEVQIGTYGFHLESVKQESAGIEILKAKPSMRDEILLPSVWISESEIMEYSFPMLLEKEKMVHYEECRYLCKIPRSSILLTYFLPPDMVTENVGN